jgi:hypothetical protein
LVVKLWCSSVWKLEKIQFIVGYLELFEPERLHRTTSCRAAPRRARSPRPPLGPERRGSLPPAGPCAVGPPASNRHLVPLHVRHVLTPAAPANQRRRRRTRATPPLVGDWPPRVAAHPAVPRPYHDLVPLARKETFLIALRTAIKAATSSPRMSTLPPPSAMGATR